jgi:hypothetical protein
VRVCATRVELLHFGMRSGTVARLVEEAGTRRTVFTTQSAEVIRAFCSACRDRDFRVMRVDFDDGRMKEPVSYSAADALSALDAGREIRG